MLRSGAIAVGRENRECQDGRVTARALAAYPLCRQQYVPAVSNQATTVAPPPATASRTPNGWEDGEETVAGRPNSVWPGARLASRT